MNEKYRKIVKKVVLKVLSMIIVATLSIHPVYMDDSSKSSGEDYKPSSNTWGMADGMEDSSIVEYISSLLKKWSWPVFIIAFICYWFGNEKKRPLAKRVCIVSSMAFVISFVMTLYTGTMDGFRLFFKFEGRHIIDMIMDFIDWILSF